jgi:hypothetical protein
MIGEFEEQMESKELEELQRSSNDFEMLDE